MEAELRHQDAIIAYFDSAGREVAAFLCPDFESFIADTSLMYRDLRQGRGTNTRRQQYQNHGVARGHTPRMVMPRHQAELISTVQEFESLCLEQVNVDSVSDFQVSIEDDNGKNHTIGIPNSLYLPGLKVCLLSPQHWAQEAGDGKHGWGILSTSVCSIGTGEARKQSCSTQL